jgi:hypothetical protein
MARQEDLVTRSLARAVHDNVVATTGSGWARRSRVNGWLIAGWCVALLYVGGLVLAVTMRG